MPRKLHSAEARRMAAMVRLGVFSSCVGAALLWALWSGSVSDDLPLPKGTEIEESRARNAATQRLDRMQVAEAAERLEIGVSAATTPAAPRETAEPLPAEANPPSAIARFAYIGPIHEHSRMVAIISVDGRQRIVPEGASLGDLTLIAVHPHEVVLKGPTGEMQIPLTERSGTSITWVTQPRHLPSDRAGRDTAYTAAWVAGDIEGMARAMGPLSPRAADRAARDAAYTAAWIDGDIEGMARAMGPLSPRDADRAARDAAHTAAWVAGDIEGMARAMQSQIPLAVHEGDGNGTADPAPR